jgi:hypothetical protein
MLNRAVLNISAYYQKERRYIKTEREGGERGRGR